MVVRLHSLILFMTASLLSRTTGLANRKRLNVLLIVSDDMRPEISCFADPNSPYYGNIHTPNLDQLASQSLVLKKAFVQQALCAPSRSSFLTGRRPDTTHVYDLQTYFRNSGGDFTTIPQYFKEHGYNSIGTGKVFHPGQSSDHNDPISWSEPYIHLSQKRSRDFSWIAVPFAERQLFPLQDDVITQQAINTLRRVAPAAKSGRQPFFVAVGFHKPHLPMTFPEEFLEFYPKTSVRLPENPFAPANMPKVAWSDYHGLRAYHDIKRLRNSGSINDTLPAYNVLTLRRAYYSAVSYVDSLVGKVLTGLEELGLANDTIVTFLGDHGWQLGEHGEWAKHTNFDLSTHAPMMIRIPGLTDGGVETEHLTEFVDLFPTLVDAAGLPPLNLCPEDSSDIRNCTEGSSLMPLIDNPSTSTWKQHVFSQYPREFHGHLVMGYSMRTRNFRYTEWVNFQPDPIYKPDWDKHFGVELYDHGIDKDENFNCADDPRYRHIRKQLSTQLRAGWRAAIP